MPSFAEGFYFWFSLIYLIIRTLAVSLYSAEINDESKRAIEVLRAIPREAWCLEVSRSTSLHDILIKESAMRP
jgi:gustatory receptor